MMMNRIRVAKDILWALAAFGLVAAIFRMWFGLGATTHLSDAVPWGLWKVLNMIAGVALSTSGFTVGFLVYVLKRERFRPLVKPAILVAFLGYGSSCVALLFDIGIPFRFWHPFVMWNEHSFLFEVFWCVMLYFTVTAVEILPPVFERFGADRLRWILHRATFGVVVVGISLSSLHHSSLGSLFLVTPLRLHELWYSSWLPLFFILSAMGGGMMLIVLAKILYARFYAPESVYGDAVPGGGGRACLRPVPGADEAARPAEGPHMGALRGLATIASSILGLYLVLKLVDLLRTGAWRALTAGTVESRLYLTELALTAVVPVVLLSIPRFRRSVAGLGLAAFSATAGLAYNRLNVGIFGYWHDAQTAYFPSLVEWSISLGVVAAAILVFLAMVENLAIFEERPVRVKGAEKPFHVSFDAFTRVWSAALTGAVPRVTLIAVFALPVAWLAMYPPFHDGGTTRDVQPPLALDGTRATLRIDGDGGGLFTVFRHADHQSRLGGDASCMNCHHLSLPGDRSTPCSRCHRKMVGSTRIFDHQDHILAVAARDSLPGPRPANRSCAVCHESGDAKTAGNAEECMECHRNDMYLTGMPPDSCAVTADACSYPVAMHGMCVACHRREKPAEGDRRLDDCGNCHESLRARGAEWARTASLSMLH